MAGGIARAESAGNEGVGATGRQACGRRSGIRSAAGQPTTYHYQLAPHPKMTPELLGLCDTIGVMCRGELAAVRPRAEWTEADIMRVATGSA